jgi:hypothetical protein
MSQMTDISHERLSLQEDSTMTDWEDTLWIES